MFLRLTRSGGVVLAVVLVAMLVAGCERVEPALRGQVTTTAEGTPAPAGVPVRAYADASETLVATTFTNSAGAYSFSPEVLPVGNYRIEFADGEWWQNASSWTAATPVSVGGATPTMVDATVSVKTGGVSGYVEFAGIVIVAFDQSTGQTVAHAIADASGRFSMTSLNVGTYTFGFFDPTHTRRPTILGSPSDDPIEGTPFAVASGASTWINDGGLSAVIELPGSDCPPSYSGADLSGLDLSHQNLVNCDFTGTTLTGVDLDGADLAGAIFQNVRSGGIIGTPAAMPVQSSPPGIVRYWTIFNGYIVGPGIDLSEADLPGLPLVYGGAYDEIDFTNANLAGIAFEHVYLMDIDFSGADLTGATFNGVSTFGGLTFDGADLSGARRISPSFLSFEEASFVGANLEGVEFAKVRFWNANLTNANFTNADLTDAALDGADLSGATLTHANLQGAGLSGATLTGVTSGGIQGTPASLPTGWALLDGVLVGP